MQNDLQSNEIETFIRIGKQDAVEWENAVNTYGDTRRAELCVAEVAFYRQFGELPEWGVVIERVEEYPEGTLWIHRDWQVKGQ